MSQTTNKGYLIKLTLVATLGGLLFGYDTGVISGTVGSLDDFFVVPKGLTENAANAFKGFLVFSTPALAAAQKSDVVILCLGLSPDIEGEEMPVLLEGFDKGDRSDITLPKTQIALMKKVQALGKPTIVVLMNGSALAVNWAGDNIPAILESWYPGEFGGKAIADVLFGDYKPGGRLPVTFYKSVEDLPDFKSYDMSGRTYKYFEGEVLFPFGHGLSYTNFEYSNLFLPETIKTKEDLKIKVDVTNVGQVQGDEVVQVYVTHNAEQSPIRTLVAFKRIQIAPGVTETVTFTINPETYAMVGDDGKKRYNTSSMTLSVGGKQPVFTGLANTSTTNVLTKELKLN